jgi:tetratricopeptide (TPR) repeat protein
MRLFTFPAPAPPATQPGRLCQKAWSLAALSLLLWLAPQAAWGQSAELKEADDLNNRIVPLFQAGRYQKALPLAQRVVATREKTLGPAHPEIAISLNNLALLYRATGAQALPLFLRVLPLVENGERKVLVQELHCTHPLYAALHHPLPVPAANLALQENEVLLENALGEAAGYVFVVRKGGVGKIVKIPLGRQELEEAARRQEAWGPGAAQKNWPGGGGTRPVR